MDPSNNPYAPPSSRDAPPPSANADAHAAEAKEVRNAMFVVAAVQGIGLVLGFAMGMLQDPFALGTVAFVGVLYLVFGLFAAKAPRPILYAGLTIYILIWVADAIADPARIMNGIIFKAIIIGAMVNAIRTMRVNDVARG
jgi:hypothetical protein